METAGGKDDQQTAVYTSSSSMTTDGDVTSMVSSQYLAHERSAEGTALLLLATTGILLNAFIFLMVLFCKDLRRFTNGFTAHGCVLDAFKVNNSFSS